MNPAPTHLTETAPALSGTGSSKPAGLRLGPAALCIAVVLGVAATVGLVPRWHERASLQGQTASLALPTVLVTSATASQPVTGLSLPAEVRPYVEAPIYARANGYLKRWLVDIGAKVQAGELLAEIDTPELRQELARARAELAQTDAALALARITAARWADLLKTASVSEQEAAEKQSDLALKTANVEAARANLRRLEELQSFARVTAPFAGTITLRKTDVGQLITAGSGRELFRLAQTDPLRVYVHVPQVAARSVAPDQLAQMNVPELPGRTFAARVVRTSGAMEADSRTLLVELEVNNTAGEILAGSYAQVRFPELKSDAVLTLPSSTLLFRAEGPQVGVVHQDGTVALHKIRIGRDFGPTMEVLEGVTPADRVIVNPFDSLLDGTKVRVADANAKP